MRRRLSKTTELLFCVSILTMPFLCGSGMSPKEERMASFSNMLKETDAEPEIKVKSDEEEDEDEEITRSEMSRSETKSSETTRSATTHSKITRSENSYLAEFAETVAKYSGGEIKDRVLVRGRDYTEKDLGIQVRSTFKKKEEDTDKTKEEDKNNEKNSQKEIIKKNTKLFEDAVFEDGSPYKVFDPILPKDDPGQNLFDLTKSLDNSDVVLSKKIFVGHFKLTAYDACIQCCGKTDGITASGTHAASGRTVAVDKALIPLGSKLLIDGHIFTAEDTGSDIKGNWIDVFMDTHEIAKQFGVKYADVYLLY